MDQIKIMDYKPSLKPYFYEINREWITHMFTMEEVDQKVLEDPDRYIIKPGGYIWFAQHPELGVVGTCALRKEEDNLFELTKMGVLKKARGLKVGELLLQRVINHLRSRNWSCYLLTNARCEAAIHLYLKNGFVHDQKIKESFGPQYQRCNVAMKLSMEGLARISHKP